jgi:hypothetical protein
MKCDNPRTFMLAVFTVLLVASYRNESFCTVESGSGGASLATGCITAGCVKNCNLIDTIYRTIRRKQVLINMFSHETTNQKTVLPTQRIETEIFCEICMSLLVNGLSNVNELFNVESMIMYSEQEGTLQETDAVHLKVQGDSKLLPGFPWPVILKPYVPWKAHMKLFSTLQYWICK